MQPTNSVYVFKFLSHLFAGALLMATTIHAETTIVNIATDTCDVYIGRGIEKYAHMLTDSIESGVEGWLGNPHHIGWCKICKKTHDRTDCIQHFTKDFLHRIETDSLFRESVLELKGKTLGCYCKPKDCHGDILVEWLEKER